ncbi:GrpB family protein [Bacillus sp. Marseille-Q3570]|uniref:GrpB family protein n=1 Tax=Bacillus sp. Marseille-Q3570 TaxID=2963522 RepID=UPI0021B7117D|nr:GrpB family protein [Bacillus sp. Marseille-Q3570]
MNNGITLIDHDPSWSDEFIKLKHVIESHLQSLVLSIEHIGSTSVKGLSAKPILDIDVVKPDTYLFPQVSTKLRMWVIITKVTWELKVERLLEEKIVMSQRMEVLHFEWIITCMYVHRTVKNL